MVRASAAFHVPRALMLLCCVSKLSASGGIQQSCTTFGNNLTQALPPASSSRNGLFVNIAHPLTCAGMATSWDVCYYRSSTSYLLTPHAYVGVYRPQSANSSSYNLVQGSSYDASVDGATITMAYECRHFSISISQFTVYPGDILVACVQDPEPYGQLGVSAGVIGETILLYNAFGDCLSLPASPLDLSKYTTLNDVTLHVRLNVNECAVNNGGCQQVCNDTNPGYACSCFNGYMLAANGLNCTLPTSTSLPPSISRFSSVPAASLPSLPPLSMLPPLITTQSTLPLLFSSLSPSLPPLITTQSTLPLLFSSLSPSNFLQASMIFFITKTDILVSTAVPEISSITPSSSYSNIYMAQQGQSFVVAITLGVIFALLFVVITAVVLIYVQQKYVRSQNKSLQDNFGIRNLTFVDSEFVVRSQLEPNHLYEVTEIKVSNTVPNMKLPHDAAKPTEPLYSTVDDKTMQPSQLTEPHTYSCLGDQEHTCSHLHDDKHSYSHIQPQVFDNGKLNYSSLRQGLGSDTHGYTYHETSFNTTSQNDNCYQVPRPPYAAVIKTPGHCHKEEQHNDSEPNENLYYLPASQEIGLYTQLQNQAVLTINKEHIETTEEVLGSGHFGGVQAAVWNGPKGRLGVAVKTLKPSSTTPENKIKFLQEAAIVAQFRHPNVIRLYGMVIDGEQTMLVLELAVNKDLLTHLNTLRLNTSDNYPKLELPKVLLSYSKQVAIGMKYLSSKSFVHRDLAARNVLVTKEGICKISDFGLSRDLADAKYYVSQGGMVPIKWTAPEAVHFMKYSTASDVWSFGCLLYEIWSVGCRPFEGLTNIEALQKVVSGYRLAPPPGCPILVYKTMIKCWNPEACNRPTFEEICMELSLDENTVLVIPNEALITNSQAGIPGAPLESGKNMYLELQNSYIAVALN